VIGSILQPEVISVRRCLRFFSLAGVAVAISFCNAVVSAPARGRAQRHVTEADPHAIACRILESHTDPDLEVTVAVFHQAKKEDQQRLGDFLRANDGELVEVRGTSGDWQDATLFRMKTCFGRGLLLLDTPLPKGQVFFLRAPQEQDSDRTSAERRPTSRMLRVESATPRRVWRAARNSVSLSDSSNRFTGELQ
jgi:hypothetical protein